MPCALLNLLLKNRGRESQGQKIKTWGKAGSAYENFVVERAASCFLMLVGGIVCGKVEMLVAQ